MKNCEECKYCYLQDYGYSNCTVEGTTFNCLKQLHPDGNFDRFYGECKKLNYAEECTGFIAGDILEIDCDMDKWEIEAYTDDEEIIKLYKALQQGYNQPM